jgi:hypothetical protein
VFDVDVLLQVEYSRGKMPTLAYVNLLDSVLLYCLNVSCIFSSFLMLPKVISGYQKGCTLDNFFAEYTMVTSTKKADEKGNFGVMVSAVDSLQYNLQLRKSMFFF